MPSPSALRQFVALDQAQHLFGRRVNYLLHQFGDVLDATQRALDGTYAPGEWFRDALAISINALQIFRCDMDYGLIFDCDQAAESVGPRYAHRKTNGRRRRAELTAVMILTPIEGESRAAKINVKAMVREEEGLLAVTLVGLKPDEPPPGRYRGTLRYGLHEYACSMVRLPLRRQP